MELFDPVNLVTYVSGSHPSFFIKLLTKFLQNDSDPFYDQLKMIDFFLKHLDSGSTHSPQQKRLIDYLHELREYYITEGMAVSHSNIDVEEQESLPNIDTNHSTQPGFNYLQYVGIVLMDGDEA